MTLAYTVVRPFIASSAISGRKRKFEPGEVIRYHTDESGATITIEADGSFFLLERWVFNLCCKFLPRAICV